jgi:hypothetical protein
MRLMVQIFFSAFCAPDVLAMVGVFDVTIVTGSASVGVSTPCLYSSEISIGYHQRSTKNQIWTWYKWESIATRTVSNVPELPELSHNVYDRSYSLAGAAIVSVE